MRILVLFNSKIKMDTFWILLFIFHAAAYMSASNFLLKDMAKLLPLILAADILYFKE